MEEKLEESSMANTKKEPIICEECKKTSSKYKCPGCSIRTCSLLCVNAHKQRTACTGKRSLSEVVPISLFDDNLLLSDYNMLEEVKRMAESSHRMRAKLCGYTQFRLPFPLKNLQKAAGSRRTKLLFHPNGMSKRETNQTYYNQKQRYISWTIEWRFHSTDVVCINHGVRENTILSSVIEEHLKPGPWNHSLKSFCDEPLDSLKFFIRTFPKGPKSLYRQLDIKAPIRGQLANIVILEYPVIHVFLPSHNCDFEIMNEKVLSNVQIKESIHRDYPSPTGVAFKEEEIKDEESLDPLISDLTNQFYPRKQIKKESTGLQQSPSSLNGIKRTRLISNTDISNVSVEDDNNIGTNSCSDQLAVISDLDFEFEPGLIDMLPEFMADINSDGLFDFDGTLPENEDLEGGIFLLEDELEEGEIA